MRSEIDIVADRAEEDLLFTAAELVMAWLIVHVDDLVGLGESSVHTPRGVMQAQRLGPRMRIDLG